MSYLHCFYGVGVTLSPYLMSLALSQSGNWHTGYRAAFFIQAAIACVTLLSLPLWRRTKGDGEPEEEPRTLGFRALAGNPSVRTAWLVFFGSCAIEYTCGTWGSTFLVEAKGMEAGEAALLLTLYYAGMAIGRFLSGVLSARLASWTIIPRRAGACPGGGSAAASAAAGFCGGRGAVPYRLGQRPGVSEPYPSDAEKFWPGCVPVGHGLPDGGLLCGDPADASSVRPAGAGGGRAALSLVPARAFCVDDRGYLAAEPPFETGRPVLACRFPEGNWDKLAPPLAIYGVVC